MISNESLFLIFNALVGFFSDIILNIIAKHDIYKPISTLRPYFENKTTFQENLTFLSNLITKGDYYGKNYWHQKC